MTHDKATIEHRFDAPFISAHFEHFEPTYNAALSQHLPIIRTYHEDRIELATWGFWPEERMRTKPSHPMINARLGTAADKPMFESSLHGRRCMVLADGYFEWRVTAHGKLPYRITLKSGEPFAMAGIHAHIDTGQPEIDQQSPVNFAILTTKANEAVQHIHDRMPVIRKPGNGKGWLHPGGTWIFNPFPSELFTSYPVKPKMNRASFNSPEAIAPLEPAIQ
jgi:putative SOS response-associated peptidase YedK